LEKSIDRLLNAYQEGLVGLARFSHQVFHGPIRGHNWGS
jgi:hypothetical protein